jgi:hypothetical protein
VVTGGPLDVAAQYADRAVRISLLVYVLCLAATGITLEILDITLRSVPAWLGYLTVSMALIAAASVIGRWYAPSQRRMNMAPAGVLAWFAFLSGALEPHKPGMWMAAIVIVTGWIHSIHSWRVRRAGPRSAKMPSRKKM